MQPIQPTLSKEEVAQLSTIASFPGTIHLIDTVEQAEAIFDQLNQEKVVGFDTESKPAFTRGEKAEVSLIQIATLTDAYLIRVNYTDFTPRLKAFIANPNILKIGLSLHDDYKVMRRRSEVEPQGFVELQKFCVGYGIKELGLQKIYGILFGERISKSQRITNWENPHLTPKQQAYAALDAYACLRIYQALMAYPNPEPWRFALV